jgi:hypothetical protein
MTTIQKPSKTAGLQLPRGVPLPPTASSLKAQMNTLAFALGAASRALNELETCVPRKGRSWMRRVFEESAKSRLNEPLRNQPAHSTSHPTPGI